MPSLRRSAWFRFVMFAFASILAAAQGALGPGDDTYRFAPAAGTVLPVVLEGAGGAVAWTWPEAGRDWDTALLGVRLASEPGGDPWIEARIGGLVLREHLEKGTQGVRWLNLSGFRGRTRSGTKVEMTGHQVRVEAGPATLRVFHNALRLKGRILVLAPHPDDAEIAAFGLYAGRDATIVTLTCGNAGDANYQDQFPDPAEQYQFKGYLRAVDSVTVPWQGGVPPSRCFNLGYFDARLQDMRADPAKVVPEVYGPNEDVSVYRRVNLGRLLPSGRRTCSWVHLVEDLARVLRLVKPDIILMPHPFLDSHSDHQFTSVAAVEAMRGWTGRPTFLLYTNHACENLYPFGPAGTPAPLPPWAGRELPVEGVYAHPLDPGLQRRKLFALESMHDLRLSPAEQGVCLAPGAGPTRPDYPRIAAVDYFRRAPRPEELFFVFQRPGAEKLISDFIQAHRD